MARDKEKNSVLLWLKAGENAPLFYPDRYFPKMPEAREQLRQRLAVECELDKPEHRSETQNWQLDRTNSPADHGPTAKLERQSQKVGWQIKCVKDLLPKAFPPDGHPPGNLTLQAIQTHLRPLLEKGAKVPSTDTIARVIGRRGPRA
jgi:hypothetical protein